MITLNLAVRKVPPSEEKKAGPVQEGPLFIVPVGPVGGSNFFWGLCRAGRPQNPNGERWTRCFPLAKRPMICRQQNRDSSGEDKE